MPTKQSADECANKPALATTIFTTVSATKLYANYAAFKSTNCTTYNSTDNSTISAT